MQITAIIADDSKPEGWPESYTLQRYMPPPYDASSPAHAAASFQIARLVARFNDDLRAHELPRRLISISLEEIEPEDAWNMGLNDYHAGKEQSKNYWPESHPNHDEWIAGWSCAASDDED